jgi:hypothetical protein
MPGRCTQACTSSLRPCASRPRRAILLIVVLGTSLCSTFFRGGGFCWATACQPSSHSLASHQQHAGTPGMLQLVLAHVGASVLAVAGACANKVAAAAFATCGAPPVTYVTLYGIVGLLFRGTRCLHAA